MQRFASDQPIPDIAKGAVFAFGKFDGVHLGHKAVLDSARAEAERLGAPLAAPEFNPPLRRFFEPDAPPFLLQTSQQRERALAEAGVTFLFEFRVDTALLHLSARAFAEHVLHTRLGVRHVSVGPNFRYGHRRSGDVQTLIRDGADLGFTVSTPSAIHAPSGEPVSSSAIRAALVRGDVAAANAMLGRPWAIEGIVAKGFARGRDFGFPTLNIALGDYLAPKLGVYAVRTDLGDGALRPGVASIGVNPTVGALPTPLLEVHLFDFDGDLYGRRVETQIVAFLRSEQHFDSVETLKFQMARDCIAARAALS